MAAHGRTATDSNVPINHNRRIVPWGLLKHNADFGWAADSVSDSVHLSVPGRIVTVTA
jgi:hypothetical protein